MAVDFDPLKDSRHRTAAAASEQAAWKAWLVAGNKAERTIDTYERYTAALLRTWPNVPFEELDDSHLLHVLISFPVRSRHIVKAAWNNWFRWGYKTGRIPGNPVDLLPTITYKPSRVYDVFSEAEADALCGLPTPDGELMMLLFEAGLRRAEAIGLTGKRIDLNTERVVVIEGAKGAKPRSVPMIPRLSSACALLLQLEGINRDDHLWGSRPGGQKRTSRVKPIGNTSFGNWWKRSLETAGVRSRNPHMARHTCATRWRQRGLAMEEIQVLLGHESISTTSDTYVQTNLDSIAAHMREVVA